MRSTMKNLRGAVLLALTLLIAHLTAVSAREIYLSTDDGCSDWTEVTNDCIATTPCCVTESSVLNITEDTTLFLTSVGARTGSPTVSFEGPHTVTIKPAGAEVTAKWVFKAIGRSDGENVVVQGGAWSAGLSIILDQVTHGKFDGPFLGEGSSIFLNAVSSFEMVDARVSVLGGHFGVISVSPLNYLSGNLPSNITHVSINNSSFNCSTQGSFDSCATVFQLDEINVDWLQPLAGGSITLDSVNSHFFGYNTFSRNMEYVHLNISTSYGFNSSSFAARSKSIMEDSYFNFALFGLSLIPERSHFMCYNCTLRPFFANTSAIPSIDDSIALAEQLYLFLEELDSATFISATVTRLSLSMDLQIKSVTVTDSNFTDVYFPLYSPESFQCSSSNFIRSTEAPDGAFSSISSWLFIQAEFQPFAPFSLSSCSFIDDPTSTGLPEPLMPNLMLVSFEEAADVIVADSVTVDRLGVSATQYVSGHLTVTKAVSSIEVIRILSRSGYDFQRSEGLATLHGRWGGARITFGGSVNVSSVTFADFAAVEYAPTRPGIDTGIVFDLPASSVPTSVFWLSMPIKKDDYTSSFQVNWPADPSFESMVGTFPFLSYPTSINLPTLPEAYDTSSANYSFNFTRQNSTSPPNGVTFERVTPSPPSPPQANGTCSAAPIPSTGFACSANGTWVTTASVTSPIVVNSPIEVLGNFSTTTVTFNGLGATIIVKGCASFLPTLITVILSPADLASLLSSKTLSKTLIMSECSVTNGQSAAMTVGAQNGSLKKCQRLSGRLESRGTSMVGVFQLDSSRCNVWWIVLIAVIGSVLLAVIVLVLVFSLVPSARRCIRPYIKRTERDKSTKLTVA